MKKFLLSIAFIGACVAMNAQEKTTYNYFDPADCDAEGWLWLDSKAKIDKYVGFASDGKTYKIYLESATTMDANMNYAEPTTDPTLKGYNEAGEEGGAGSWTGGIVLPAGSSSIGSTPANGGGILLNLPDCAEYDLALSTPNSYILTGIEVAPKMNAPVVDLQNIKVYMKMGFLSKPLVSKNQVKWLNLQDFVGVTDEAKGWTIGGENNPTTSCVRNNCNQPLYVQGIKVFTYTNTNAAGVNDIVADDENAAVEYFNLQGMKVAGDQPGLYIRRQGSKTTKVIIK